MIMRGVNSQVRKTRQRAKWLPVLGAVLCIPLAQAVPVKTDHTQAELLAETSSIRSGETFTLGLKLTPDPGWHTYWINPGDAGKAASLRWNAPEGLVFGELGFPAPGFVPFMDLMSYGYNPATDAHPVLLEAGIFTALDASWRELSPLGRAEWLKFTALFYNREAQASAIYDDIVAQYETVKASAATVEAENRPTILINSFLGYADAWYIPGEDTYVGQLIRDAGGDLLLAEAGSASSRGLSFEAAYEGGFEADIWLVETFGVNSSADLLALDSRFGDFGALQSGNIWNNNRDENSNGGNNFYEWGVASPHLVLADLLAIFHPDLRLDHEFAFYQRLASD